MSKILITGGSGYIAEFLRIKLLDAKHNVCAQFHKDLDITNYNQIKGLLENGQFDYVIHTAIQGNGKKDDKINYFYNNLLMVENLLSLSNKYSKLILFDSGAAFDRRYNIFNRVENDFRTVPVDFYGLAKYINTKRSYGNNKVVNLRLFNVFGPKERGFRFVKACISKCIKNEDIHIFNDIFFSFFYIEDLFTVINHLIENPPSDYYELNCVYPEAWVLAATAHLIKLITKSESNIIVDKISNLNYHGNGNKLHSIGLNLKGLMIGLEEVFIENKNL